MKKMLIFLTILLFTASVFATDNNNVASFTEWIQINGYTPGYTDDPGDIIEQWAAPNGSPMGIEWDADGDFIWHVSENAPNDCMYHIEVATPHAVLNSYPCPNPYGIPDGGSMNGACIGNGYLYYTDFQGDLSTVDDHIVQVDRNTLVPIDQWEVDPDIDQILGITYKAPYFYIVCNSVGNIYEVDLQPGGVYSIISTIPAPGGGALSGIHYLAGNDTFWLASFLGGVVYETDSSFNILQTIPAPGGASAMGITWPGEGENYWLTDFGNDQFYIIDGDIVVSGQQTIQVDPLAVPYWTGTTDGNTFTDDSEVRGWDTEDGWMMFDISAIPAGATILEIEFNGYVNATYYPYWQINGVAIDPLTATPADLMAEIQTNEYNMFLEPSTFPTGWKVDILGGTANADMQAATVQGWFCLGINSTDNSTTYYINFDGWDEANPPFLMVTYEGGGALAELSGVVSEFGTGTPIEGAEVTIAGTVLSATTLADGSYSIVDIIPAVYDISCEADLYITAEELGFDIVSGPNTLDFSLLWSEIETDVTELTSYLAPEETEVQTFTITNAGPGDLEYNISLDLPAEIRVINRSRNNNSTPSRVNVNTSKQNIIWETNNSIEDRDPNASNHAHGTPATDDLFDSQFEWPVGVGGGEAGIETDGNYLYTTKWNGTVFYKYELDGTYIEEFSVTGCPGSIRDLAYDGQYFYGAAATNTVYEMDFDAQTTISTINAPIAVRAIAYDPVNDGFWGNNWSDQITLFDRNGSTLDSFPCGTFLSYYGFAWEDVLPGGPYLWGYSQDGPTLNQLVQFDIATGLETGVNFDIGSIFTVGTGIAGGLCISDAFVPGKWTLCGTSQNTIIWGVELADAVSWVMVTDNISGTVPGNGGSIVVEVTFDAAGLTVGEILTGDLLIHNNSNYTATRGDDYVIPVTLNVGGTALEVPTNVSVDPDLGLLTWDAPAPRDLIGYNVYLDGTLEGTTTDTEWQYEDLVNGEDYVAGVSAVYDEGESDIVEFPFTYTGVGADNIVNIITALKGNYPNPFNPVTNIAFSLSEPGHVTLEVYNMKGEKVRTLVDKVLTADNHVIIWDGKNNTNKSVSSGVYFYKMISEGNSGEYTSTKKMILMK